VARRPGDAHRGIPARVDFINESSWPARDLRARQRRRIDSWVDQFEPRAAGVSILLVENPGYGRSSGSPSERSIARAMAAAYDWAASRPSVDRRHQVDILGEHARAALAVVGPSGDDAIAPLILRAIERPIRTLEQRLGSVGDLRRRRDANRDRHAD
jgi:hypothetical protein